MRKLNKRIILCWLLAAGCGLLASNNASADKDIPSSEVLLKKYPCGNNPISHSANPIFYGLDDVLLYVQTYDQKSGVGLPVALQKDELTKRAIDVLKRDVMKCLLDTPNEKLKDPIVLTDYKDSRVANPKNLTAYVRVQHFRPQDIFQREQMIILSVGIFRPDPQFFTPWYLQRGFSVPIFLNTNDASVSKMIDVGLKGISIW